MMLTPATFSHIDKNIESLAPIVLFTYNRPIHTQQTIKALSANKLAQESLLYIYQDAAKNDASQSQKAQVARVKAFIKAFIAENTHKCYFKHIIFIERNTNLGLADSIVDGVSAVMNAHHKAIILEDDILVSPVFLDYMNDALNKYANEPKVWSIAAWGYPISAESLGDCYFWRLPHCWGWGSWARAWQHFKRDIDWVLKNFTKADIAYININGSADYFSHLIANKKGKIKTWAIFNYLISYKHSALTLCPSVSYVRQIGFDGSGVHCGASGEVFNAQCINTKFPISYPSEIVESPLALQRIIAFERAIKTPLHTRAYNKLRKISRGAAHKFWQLAGGGAVNNPYFVPFNVSHSRKGVA